MTSKRNQLIHLPVKSPYENKAKTKPMNTVINLSPLGPLLLCPYYWVAHMYTGVTSDPGNRGQTLGISTEPNLTSMTLAEWSHILKIGYILAAILVSDKMAQ